MSLSITVTNNVSSQTGAVESVVLVDGEVDVSNADQLRTVLDGRVEDAPTELVVDHTKLPDIDSTGLGGRVGAAPRAAEKNVRFEVANPQRNVERVLGLLGVSNDLNVRGA